MRHRLWGLAIAIILFIAVTNIFFEVGRVASPGVSMLPLFVSNDIHLTLRWWIKIDRHDVVILLDPTRDDRFLIKRVIGLPGDTLEMKHGKIFVNGVLLHEPYIENSKQEGVENFILRGSYQKNILIGKDFFFVMGDNRDNSYDSRNFGPVHKKYIQGKVVCIFWPLSHFKIF